ncbi:hypothetical protein AGMMS49983_08810 [Clostridia bacterium]|nr:hypothetical protein AGMMS49983_08810 [Clostridia bacterium]
MYLIQDKVTESITLVNTKFSRCFTVVRMMILLVLMDVYIQNTETIANGINRLLVRFDKTEPPQ